MTTPYGPPAYILKGVSDLLTRAVTMTDSAILTDDWSDPLNRIRLEELETVVYQARRDVLEALKSAAHEASKLKSTKKSRAKGHRPIAWRQHDPVTGKITGFRKGTTEETPQ